MYSFRISSARLVRDSRTSSNAPFGRHDRRFQSTCFLCITSICQGQLTYDVNGVADRPPDKFR
jgi:hypothetical protein